MANLYDKAGLVNIPVGYQEGFLYNIKPEDNTLGFRFNRDSAATRVNKEGLIEQVGYFGPELITNGNFATDSDWTKGSAWTIANGQASYDASGINPITSATTSIVSGKTYRLKFKITTSGFARLHFTSDSSQTLFRPNGNSVNYFDSGEYTFYLSAESNSTALKIFAYNNSGGTSFSIDNISVTEVLGDKPRIDYTDSLTSPSFLLEPQSTNLIANSNSSFSISSSSSISYNQDVSPTGEKNAFKVVSIGTDPFIQQNCDTTNTTFTLSIYAKGVGNTIGKNCNFYLVRDNYSEAVQSLPLTLTSQWQRFEATLTLSTAPTSFVIWRFDCPSVAEIGDEVLLFGAQLEELSYATSYIPTAGSTATRAQETCNGAGSSSTFNSTEGVLYAEISANENVSGKWISLSNGTTNERISIAFQANDIRLYIKNTSGLIWDYTYTSANIFNYNKIGLKYKSGDYALWINGIEVATDSNSNLASNLSGLQFNSGGGVSHFYGKVKGVYVFNEALTDDELQQLTGPEYNSFAALAAAYNYTVI